jgi:calcineurin-like phosphoesterase family protein
LARRRIGRDHVLMCHLPYEGDHVGDERYARFRLRDEGLWLLHGHVHDAWKVRGCQINVGVDVWGWRPVNLEEIHKIIDGVSSPTVVQRDRVSG